MAIEERLNEYNTYDVIVTSRNTAKRKLAELKEVEKRLLREGRLQKVEVLNGYAMTTYPNRFRDIS